MAISLKILLLALLFVFALSVLISGSGLAPSLLASIFFACLAVNSLIFGLHLPYSWFMFYANPHVRRKWSEREFALRFLLLPLVYASALIGFTVWFAEAFPGYQFIPYLLIIVGPNFYHQLQQDRGVLILLQRGDVRPPPTYFIWAGWIAVMLPLFLGAGLTIGWLPLSALLYLKWLYLGLALVFLSLGARWYWQKRKSSNAVESIYLANIGAWALSRPLGHFAIGLLPATRTLFNGRHRSFYVFLVNRYFRSLRDHQETNLTWPMIAAASLICGLPIALLTLHLDFQIARQAFQMPYVVSPMIKAAEPFLFGLLGAISLHHYQIEAHAWKISDSATGPALQRAFPRNQPILP